MSFFFPSYYISPKRTVYIYEDRCKVMGWNEVGGFGAQLCVSCGNGCCIAGCEVGTGFGVDEDGERGHG